MDLHRLGFRHLTPFHVQVLCLGIPNQDCSTTTVVNSGDTCNSIADTAGIPVSTLMQNNPTINLGCTNIYSGEVRRRSHLMIWS